MKAAKQTKQKPRVAMWMWAGRKTTKFDRKADLALEDVYNLMAEGGALFVDVRR